MHFKSRHSLIHSMSERIHSMSSWEWPVYYKQEHWLPRVEHFTLANQFFSGTRRERGFCRAGNMGLLYTCQIQPRNQVLKIPFWEMGGVQSFCHPRWILFPTNELLMESNRKMWRSCAPTRQGPGVKVFMDKMYVLLVEQRALPSTQHEVMQGWSSIE